MEKEAAKEGRVSEAAEEDYRKNNSTSNKMALAKIPTEMQPTQITYGPDADVNTEITEETTLKEVSVCNVYSTLNVLVILIQGNTVRHKIWIPCMPKIWI